MKYFNQLVTIKDLCDKKEYRKADKLINQVYESQLENHDMIQEERNEMYLLMKRISNKIHW